MRLWILKYLFLIIFAGEKTSKDLSAELGESVYGVSHAMSALYKFHLVRHPANRATYWIANTSNPIIIKLEKLLLMSQNNAKYKKLLTSPSFVRLAPLLIENKRGVTIRSLMSATLLSKATVLNILTNLISLKFIHRSGKKPYQYHVTETKLSELFFEVSSDLASLSISSNGDVKTTKHTINNIVNDESVLVLAHYGSSARGKNNKLSDVDLFVVARDSVSRGNILSRYSQKNMDLSVYTKSGFLQLIKKQPDFINNIAGATILKGQDIIEAVVRKK